MLGGFILQPTFGALLDITSDSNQYTAGDYRVALTLMPISLIVGTVLCIWVKDTVKET
jgi:preprotein translocase subunit SecY